LPGEGLPWTVRFKVAARYLHRLPKRLRGEKVGLSIWESRITVGNWLYEGIVGQSASATPLEIQ
jgi:hypothetical protein